MFKSKISAIIILSLCSLVLAISPSQPEINLSRQWVAEHFVIAPAASIPFSFMYEGKPSSELLSAWQVNQTEKSLSPDRVLHTITFTDPATLLQIRCEATEYTSYPAAEWVVYFKNTGDKDTPILKDVQALNMSFSRPDNGNFILHHARGSEAGLLDFQPLVHTIAPESNFELFSHGMANGAGVRGGTCSVEYMPFFNLEGAGNGIITAVGWTGTWRAKFSRTAANEVKITAGMDRTELSLYPGEQIRTPRILALYWEKDRIRGHNLWRRLLRQYYSPRPGGQPFRGLICDSNWGWMPASQQIEAMDRIARAGLPVDCYWIDASWSGTSAADNWIQMLSNRQARPDLYPRGMKEVSDAAHQRHMKLQLWFVPHCIDPSVEIGKEHPEWLGEPYDFSGNYYSLDHGDPKVNQFMIEYYTKIVRDYGLDVFREDGRPLWPSDNKPGRIGAVQAHYIEGYYAFRDALLKNHPSLIIDNCGEGGKKVDIETISRSILMWRSDFQCSGNPVSISNQLYTFGLSYWIPLYSAAASWQWNTKYDFRGAFAPSLVLMSAVSDLNQKWNQIDLNLLKAMLEEYLSVRDAFYGDYYPLLPYDAGEDSWLAWQFDQPEEGKGLVQAFRRSQSRFFAVNYLLLHGLDPDALYQVTDLDVNQPQTRTGRDLMEKGLELTAKEKPAALIVTYQKIQK